MTNEEQTDVIAPEETQSDEQVETPEEKPLTIEDYKELEKKYKTALAQKEHYKKKAIQAKETLQTNTPTGLTREDAETIALKIAKGLTDEEVEMAAKVAKVNGVSVAKALEDDYVQAKINARIQKERSDKAALGASAGGTKSYTKPIAEMTPEEHREAYKNLVSQL